MLLCALSAFVLLVDNDSRLNDVGDQLRRLLDATDTSSAAAIDKPNLLFLQLDQWRYDWDGFHASPTGPIPLDLPFLRSSAAKGVRFTQAYVPSPLCAPSRACLASGKEYDSAGVPTNHADLFPVDQTTTYKLLRDTGGYHTMTVGKDDLLKGDPAFPYYPDSPRNPTFGTMDLGFSDAIRSAGKTKVVREFSPFEPYRTYLNEKTVTLQNGTEVTAFDAYEACWGGHIGKEGSLCDATSFTEDVYPDQYVRDSAIEILKRKPKDKPWFLQVNFPGPHPPILATADMAEKVKGRVWPPPYDNGSDHQDICPQQDLRGEYDHPEHQPVNGGRCNYGAELENLDALMSTIVDHLSATQELSSTIVCIGGDHGEMLGDHGLHGKGIPWQASISVPLICFGPGVREGLVYDRPVTTLDLAGTFLDYAQVEDTEEVRGQMTTMSLRSAMEGQRSPSTTSEGQGPEEDVDIAKEVAAKLEKFAEHKDVQLSITKKSTGPPSQVLALRSFVSSGLDRWRVVVKDFLLENSDGSSSATAAAVPYKLVCCRGKCPGTPHNVVPLVEKNSNAATYAKMDSELPWEEDWHVLLFDAKNDPYDTTNLATEVPRIVEELRGLLPEGWCPRPPSA